MVNKTVMSVNMECDKCKRIALRSVTEIDGIDSIEFNMKEKTMTVVGDADPVDMANELRRKFRCARLISHGPPPPPPKAEQPKQQNKESKGDSKNEKESKGESKNEKAAAQTQNKQPPKTPPKNEKPQEVVPFVSYPPYPIYGAYNAPPHCCCGWSPCSCRSGIDVYVVNEEPPPCTIC